MYNIFIYSFTAHVALNVNCKNNSIQTAAYKDETKDLSRRMYKKNNWLIRIKTAIELVENQYN